MPLAATGHAGGRKPELLARHAYWRADGQAMGK